MPIGHRLLIAIGAIAMAFMLGSLLIDIAADGRFRAMFDEPWPQASCRIASVAAIFCAGPVMLVSIYYFLSMLPEVRPERRMLVQFTAPIAIFLPQFWTEKGNRHRKRYLLWITVFGLLASIPFMCKSFVL